MSETEKVINDLNVVKLILCNPQMLTTEMCIRIGQAVTSAVILLKKQETALESLELLKGRSQWHPFDPLEPDDAGLKDHNYYLVTVKGFETPMKAMYHSDMPFGFQPPLTRYFDPHDVIAWRELPDNMDKEVNHDE